MTFDLDSLIRPNIRKLKPYSSARSEFEGSADIFLDANENANGSPAGNSFNRYPDPLQKQLKDRIAEMNNIPASSIFVGNGSDEAIDLLFRTFCRPGQDEAIICPPTYGMYKVSADINDVVLNEVPLTADFQLDVPAILGAMSDTTKLIFMCSPNNPTGNRMRREDILSIAGKFRGIVVVDEAYIHFSDEPSLASELGMLPNLVVLQTLSKAWGMAGLRIGLAFASEAIIDVMNRVKPPYNVSGIAQQAALDALNRKREVEGWINDTLGERQRLGNEILQLPFVETIYPSDANFILVKTRNAEDIYSRLISKRIVVRNRNNVELCEGCLRITVGTKEENDRLISALGAYSSGEK